MEILTNEIEVLYENVEEFYDVFGVKLSHYDFSEELRNGLYKDIVRLIDIIDKEKVKSIYRRGSEFTIYLLVDKAIYLDSENIFIDSVFFDSFKKKYCSLRFFKVDFAKGKYANEKNRIILNLLLNNFKNINTNLRDYDGKLHEYLRTKRKEQVVTFNYYFDNMYLCVDVVTFSLKKTDRVETVYHLDGIFLRKGNNEKQQYIRRNTNGEKNIESFFNPMNKDKFLTSKLVKIWELLDSFNEYYKEFIKIGFKKKPVNEIRYESISSGSINRNSYSTKIEQIIKKKEINLINNLDDSCDVKSFINYFEKKRIPYSESKSVVNDTFNINLIHEKSKERDDKYIGSMNVPIQNVTYEKFLMEDGKITTEQQEQKHGKGKFNDALMRVIFSELVLKNDIINRGVSIYNTKNKILENFVFGITKKINKDYYNFELDIVGDQMTFSYHKNEKNKLKEANYLVSKNTNAKVFIKELNEFPIANIIRVREDMVKFHKSINVPDFISILNKIDRYLFEGYDFDGILKNLQRKDEVSLSSFRTDIGKNLRNRIKKQLFEISEGRYFLVFSWRKKEGDFVNIYTNLKYWVEGGKLKYYSTGCKNLNEYLPRKYIVREIGFEFSDDEVKDYFKLLDTDNIRNNQASVLPFTYKYLREYMEMITRNIISKNDC